MVRSRIFARDNLQAVHLPKEVAFPDGVRDVVILMEGARRVIVPAHSVWDDFFCSPGIDLPPREQPEFSLPKSFPSS